MDTLTKFFSNPGAMFLSGMAFLVLFLLYFLSTKDRRKRNVGSILTLAVCGFCLLAASPPGERLKGGIDILGGSSFTLRVQSKTDDGGHPLPVTGEQVDQAIAVIEKRLNALGTADCLLARQGTDRILLQMPGVEPEESARIRGVLESVAKLELREVHPRNDDRGADGKTLAERVVEGTEIVPGYLGHTLTHTTEDGRSLSEPLVLNMRPALGGSDIARAFPSPERLDAVGVTLNSEGTKKMIRLTQGMRPGIDRIAILLDGEAISAPVVQDVPLGKDFSISGLDEPGEVQTLANALMNPLENPLVVETFHSVSASFGASIVEQGIWSGVVGLAITFGFVLLYYRTAGLIAIFGLLVNGVVLFGTMALLGFTFTLPGIAGMILTIGMAVDANVLIYERMREEIESGKSVKNAIAAAYEKAFSAIFDANLTSLITAVILFWMASGTIKGFAVTLTIGLVASMFSAILVTRVFFQWGADLGILRKLKFLNLIPATQFDFLRWGRLSVVASALLVVVSLGTFAVNNRDSLGVDFTGGTRIQFEIGEEKLALEQATAVVDALPLAREAFVQQETSPTSGTILSVRCDTADADAIVSALQDSLPILKDKAANTEEVSALLGGTFLTQSLIALAIGLGGILVYIAARFEWSFAVGGFVATVHDVVVTLGIVILLGGQLSLIHVGAILTVAGYSVNDTIVIFDRIRESLRTRGGSVQDLMNEAINATLSRTVLTSSTTILTVAILLFFGGSALRDFSLTILIGLLVGTYSSVFVASPVVLWAGNRRGRDLRKIVLEGKDPELPALGGGQPTQ